MKKFGDKDKFAIWVNYYFISYKDDPEFIENFHKFEMGADVYFWVNGKNIFGYKCSDPNSTYGFDLSVLINFFCNNLYYQITDDPFPVKTVATTGRAMMDETQLFPGDDDDLSKYADVDWDNIDMDLREQIHMWNYHHGFLTNGGGSFLPHAYLRKVGDKVEISWRNNNPFKGQYGKLYLKYDKGVEFIDIKLYKDTAVSFCIDYINKFSEKYPESMQDCRTNLQKAIDVVL